MSRISLALALALACGAPAVPSRPASRPAPRGEPADQRPEDPAAADAVAAVVRTHETLTAVSVVPVGSHVLCNAAMAAAAEAIGQPPEAVAWSGDGERDRALLGRRVAGVLRRARRSLPADLPLRLVRAMAMRADDPHVFALDPAALGSMLAQVSGQTAPALGFAAHQAGGRWIVSAVHPGGPAAAAGVQRGETLLSLGGRPFDQQSLIAALHVVAGQRFTLETESGGKRKLLELVAQPVELPIVETRALKGGIGYLRIHRLTRAEEPAGDAAVLVAGALKELAGKKLARLVIDLRDNPGGAPFDVASILVRGDPLLQLASPGQPPQPVARTAEAWKKRSAVAVLVNGQTYAAAEMIALALQGHGEARLFGQPTGGGLTIPAQAQLPGGVTLIFPGQLVLDPKGKVPADRRVAPDELAPSTTAEDYAAGRDRQLEAALAWLRKR